MSDTYATDPAFDRENDRPVSHPAQLTDPKVVLRYVLAGNAKVTLVSRKTGTRFTYKVNKPADPDYEYGQGAKNKPYKPLKRDIRFVAVLTSPDNERGFTYLGQIYPSDMNYGHGLKSRISRDAPSAKAFAWFWHALNGKHELLEQLEIWHEGTCGKCGRSLTDPDSIARGIGPVCADNGGY